MTSIKAALLIVVAAIAASACTTYGDHAGDWGCALVRQSAAQGFAEYNGQLQEWHFLWAFSDDGPAIPVTVGSRYEDSCWN